jgi:hypothetical protein
VLLTSPRAAQQYTAGKSGAELVMPNGRSADRADPDQSMWLK